MKLEGQFWITHDGKNLAGQARIELLTQIANTGSITQAAKAAGISYKSAWDSVDAMNNAAGSPLVARAAGGKGGGGTQLTAAGQQLVEAFARYQQEHQRFLERLSEDSSLEPYLQIMDRLRLRTSARNQLLAKVRQIHPDGLNDRIELQLHGSAQSLTALITHTSSERLNLKVGADVFALIKASWVRLLAADALAQPADNLLQGEVLQIERGALETEVQIQLPGGTQLTAQLMSSQIDALGLAVDGPAHARIDPEQIILCSI
ncbi:MAG: TOBE domain-containing protein [Pseudomonas sp.]|uniref:TOBE domain-containing protein n=1 Tax=Pseudomonas sp. TaxID=306 RepID=UPI003BB6D173